MEMPEMKNMIPEVRNSLDGCNHRSDKVEDSITEPSLDQYKYPNWNRGKRDREKNNNNNRTDLWENIKWSNINVIGVPEAEEGESEIEEIFEDTLAKNFAKLIKDNNPKI